MSRQKILTIVCVALLVVMVIVAFNFKGKYDDASALLVAARIDAADQKKAAEAQSEELNKQIADAKEQLAALQAEADTAKAAIDELTAGKEAAEKRAAELEASGKEAADALTAESEALKNAEEALAIAGAEAEATAAALTESQAALKTMTAQYNRAKADLDAKITRYNIVRESHAKLAEKYDLLAAELEALKAAEAETAEPERYESLCGVSFVLPEGAEIGNESSRMVEILLPDEASIKINMSTDRANILWYDAEIEIVNQLIDTLVIN